MMMSGIMRTMGARLHAKILVAAACLLAVSHALAVELQKIESSALPGDTLELRLSFNGKPPEPTGYTIESPARIALDLQGVTSALKERYHALGGGNVRSATIMDTSDRTRIIVNLTSLVGYTTRIEGNDLFVRIGAGDVAAQVTAAAPSDGGATQSVSSGKRAVGNGIQEIDFRRGAQGEGQIMVTLSDPNSPIDMREEGGRVVVEFVGASLPPALHRRLDVVDFATPVKMIDAVSDSGNARISIESTGNYEYMAYQTGNMFTVAVKPVTSEELDRKRKERFQFTGDKLSLNFQDIEVRAVLQLIADFTELNLVASDTVNGRITLRLQNVPWDQALDLILKTKGLDKRQVGNVMLVAPADEIAAREKLELEANRQVEELAPLRTEYLTVNYAKASEIQKLLRESGRFLTERGSVTIDERTNTLIIQDTAQRLDEIRFLLERIDVPVRQVMIEARIVIARASAAEELGVRWGLLQTRFNNDAQGNLSSMTLLGGRGQALETNVESITTQGLTTIGIGLPVDMGVTSGGASSLALGFWDRDSGLIDLELSALESDGKADVVSTPKVLTADQQNAVIKSGTEIPYQEASSSGATTTAFKEAVLALDVTPQITPDGRIIMALKVNQDSIGAIDIASGIPVIDTNSIETSVIVDNGQTVVLGGVFRSEDQEDIIKTPFLGDLPIIGRLFRQEIATKNKTELLVFITPRIVTDVLAAQ